MVLKPLRCLIPSRSGAVCNAYLNVDVEACAVVTLQVRCRHRHAAGHSNRIEFTQDEFGVITYREVPETEKKHYMDDNVRLSM
jgi:hypothetical protein